MLTDFVVQNGFGKITKNIKPDTAVVSVVDFVENHLQEFAEKYGNIKNEKGLTDYLISLLEFYTHQGYHLFRFGKDDPQNSADGNSPTVDIGVRSNEFEGVIIGTKLYQRDESFFSFETKILTENFPVKRKREYLIGRYEKGKYKDCGAVERFKKGIHGSKLKYSGIIGYVQDHDYSYWHSTINSWIDELASSNDLNRIKWNEEDKLREEHVNISARYKSENSRLNNDNIILFHLWIYTGSQPGACKNKRK